MLEANAICRGTAGGGASGSGRRVSGEVTEFGAFAITIDTRVP
jgi:hypothetical protein